MIEPTPSSEMSVNVVEQVFALAKESHETLGRLGRRLRYPYPEEHERDDHKAMMAALGSFAHNHLDELDEIPELALPSDVQTIADTYLGQLLRDKLTFATYRSYSERAKDRMKTLLNGHVVMARTLLSYGFNYGDGYTETTSDLRSVTGRVVAYEPVLANVWIGQPNDAYKVSLWGRRYNSQSQKSGPLEREAELEISS